MKEWSTTKLVFVKFTPCSSVLGAKAARLIGILWCLVKICGPDSFSHMSSKLALYVLQDGPTIILLVLANDNTPRHPRPDIDFPTESLMSLLSFVFAVLGPSFSKCPQMLLSLQTSNGYDVWTARNPLLLRKYGGTTGRFTSFVEMCHLEKQKSYQEKQTTDSGSEKAADLK